MLPFFNMRFYRNGNMAFLQPFIEKMKKGELTLENILEEDEIVQDIKSNPNSQFIEMLSTSAIRKLIDYATKMPKSDDKDVGYKFPFNATEILCCDNNAVMERIMNEVRYGADDEEEEDEKDEGEKENKEEENSEEEKKKEENEDFFAVKEEENKEMEHEESPEKEKDKEEQPEVKNEEKSPEEKKDKEEPKNEDVPKEPEQKKEDKKEGEEQAKPEEKKEEPKKVEEQAKPEEKEEPKKEEKTEEQKPEEPKKEEKPEEQKKDEPKTEEPKKEEKSEEQKKDEEKEKPKIEEPKKDETNPEEPKKVEAPQEEPKPEESKTEEPPKEEIPKEGEQKEEPPKEEIPKEVEQKEEPPKEEIQEPEKSKEVKQPEDQTQKEEKGEEKQNPPEISNKSENPEEPKNEEEESPKKEENEEPKQEENENQKNEEDNEKTEEQEKEEEEQPKEVTIIYDNVDYLLGFLNESEETKSNYVLVGYFYKIVNHLFNSQSSKIIQYLFDYPKKNEFDVLGLIVKNMKRKSMGELVNKLLLFQDEGGDDFLPKKLELLLRVLEELKETEEEDKYKCICATLESTFYNKSFFVEFMKDSKYLKLLYAILEKSQENQKKTIAVLKLLINVHENILKNEDERITPPITQENPMDFLSMFTGNYGLDEANQKELNPELQAIVDRLSESLIELIKKSNFNFIKDLDDYSSQENSEFMSTYQIPQRKLGMKKLTQVEFFRTILDVLVNAYAKFDVQEIKESVINIINLAQENKLFWKLHKLFFDFPFCNLYQSFYLQIIDIILNEHSPKELIDYVFIEKEGEKEKNIIQILLDKILHENKFTFTSKRIAFHPNYSYEISILNKILASTNEYVKELIKDNKDLSTFEIILGKEIDTIFNQKLLLPEEKDISIGQNIPLDKEENPVQYFGKKNFMQLVEQDNEIYAAYLKGEDYETLLNEKKEQEKKEKEERQKQEENVLNEGAEEEMVPGLGDSINIIDDSNNASVEKDEEHKTEEEENKKEEEEDKDKREAGKEEEASEETEEEKQYNDVNFWKSEIKPDDNIMSAILNDLD